MKLERIIERIYEETDIARSIATSLAGLFGLFAYMLWQDWVIALLAIVISFPILRVLCKLVETRSIKHREIRFAEEAERRLLDSFSEQELDVVKKFVKNGGSVLSFSIIERKGIFLDDVGTRSLMNRDFLRQDVIGDIREGLVLDTELFDVARKHLSVPDGDN